jgi:hypothetical protein
VLTPRSPGDQDSSEDRESHYCIVEIMNTSASPIEIGKNEKLGEGEPLALRDDEVVENVVFSVSEGDDRSSAPPELEKGIMSKREHLVKAERDVLRPVIKDYYDLFLYDRSGLLPCTGKGFHEIKTENALPIKKNMYKVPFALRDEMKRLLD